jgi:hypothetical protein
LDYDPATLSRHVGAIRDQLGILEATSVPDTDEPESFSPPPSPDFAPLSDKYGTEGMSGLVSRSNSAFGYSTQSTGLGTTIPSGTSTSSPSMCSEGDDPQTEHELLSGFFPNLYVLK